MDRLNVLSKHLSQSKFGCAERNQCSGIASIEQSPLFQYSLDNSLLTLEQRQFYEDNGYLIVKNLVSKDKLEKYRRRFEELCQKGAELPFLMQLVRDVAFTKQEKAYGEKAITKINHFNNDEELFSYCTLPEVLKYVECFTGPNIMSVVTMLINKPPDPGTKSSRHPMHQDLHYFPFRPADRIVCSWTAMQKVYRKNGCLVAVPGSHKGELLEHAYPDWEGGVNKMYHGIKNYSPDDERVWLEMEAGDTVFFHPMLIHGSGMNRTDGCRKSISCHYAASECEYIDVLPGTPQYLVEQEYKDMLRVKNIPVPDGFKQKDTFQYAQAKLVQGDRINL